MATKTYLVTIFLTRGESGEADGIGEYYGTFAFRAEGGSGAWEMLAQATDSSPWVLRDTSNTRVSFSADQGVGGTSSIPTDMRIVYKNIDIPASATFIEVQACLKEYDPTVFDEDESLGAAYLRIPTTNSITSGSTTQGDSLSGKVTWRVDLRPDSLPYRPF